MGKAIGRTKLVNNSGDFSTPCYNPRFELVEKRPGIGTPSFSHMTGRKTMVTEPECRNIYDVREIYENLD